MTLIERLAGIQPFEDYEFHARRRFCQPSEKTLAFARKVFDRLKKEELEFHEKVYNYVKSQTNRNNFISIDATKSIDEVFSKVLKIIYSIKK